MIANQRLSITTAALLTSAVVIALSPIQATAQSARASPEVARACTGIERGIAEKPAKACAQALEKRLNAKDIDVRALKTTPKLMLQRSGLTEQQLEGAEIVIRDETGGSSAERIDITISCCPPLMITIRL